MNEKESGAAEKVGAAPEPAEASAGVAAPVKRRRKKALAVLGVLAAVVVAAAIGFALWHEQPGFCNALCHSPMDPYVEGFASDDPNLLVTSHKASGDACLDCHEAKIDQQVFEAVAWATGDFDDPIKATRLGTTEFCLRCHDDGDAATGEDWDDIVASTAGYSGSARNPHDSHQGMIDCGTCHSMHGTSSLYCRKCHSELEEPAGWK